MLHYYDYLDSYWLKNTRLLSCMYPLHVTWHFMTPLSHPLHKTRSPYFLWHWLIVVIFSTACRGRCHSSVDTASCFGPWKSSSHWQKNSVSLPLQYSVNSQHLIKAELLLLYSDCCVRSGEFEADPHWLAASLDPAAPLIQSITFTLSGIILVLPSFPEGELSLMNPAAWVGSWKNTYWSRSNLIKD